MSIGGKDMSKPHLTVSAAIIFNDARDRLLITRRRSGGPHGGLWEFPGGKVEPGETPQDCLGREIREELGIDLCDIIPYMTVDHEYEPFTITLHTFSCLIAKGEPRPIACSDLKWVQVPELLSFSFPEADRAVIDQLLRDFSPGALAVPVTDILDLHTFQPRDVKPLLQDYLESCLEKGFDTVRIIHGKGTGTLKRVVRGVLSATPFVRSFHDAPEEAGGWGATVVYLEPSDS